MTQEISFNNGVNFKKTPKERKGKALTMKKEATFIFLTHLKPGFSHQFKSLGKLIKIIQEMQLNAMMS